MISNNIPVSWQCGRNQILPVNQRLKNLLLRREEAIGSPTESPCIRFKKNYLASFFFFFFFFFEIWQAFENLWLIAVHRDSSILYSKSGFENKTIRSQTNTSLVTLGLLVIYKKYTSHFLYHF